MNDDEIIALSLEMRANWIETGNPSLSARDAINSKQPKLIKALDDEQMELVRRIRKLARKHREAAMDSNWLGP